MAIQPTQEQKDKEWFYRVLAEDTAKGINLDSLIEEIQAISNWYDRTPSIVNQETMGLWKDFGIECYRQSKIMTKAYGVNVKLVTGQPYETLAEMSADILRGTLKISIDNSNHPIMTDEETVFLRVWHDLTHHEIQSNFGFLGEVATYKRQVEHIQNLSTVRQLTHVLYCDIVGQVANGLIHRKFPIQKVFTMEVV